MFYNATVHNLFLVLIRMCTEAYNNCNYSTNIVYDIDEIKPLVLSPSACVLIAVLPCVQWHSAAAVAPSLC